jgi:hypothetical protein
MTLSEVMRDIDVVVSVAHVGGVDPEASHSSIEMRSVLQNTSLLIIDFNAHYLKDKFCLVNVY